MMVFKYQIHKVKKLDSKSTLVWFLQYSLFKWYLDWKRSSGWLETSVTNNCPSQDSNHTDNLFQSRYATPEFKPFSYFPMVVLILASIFPLFTFQQNHSWFLPWNSLILSHCDYWQNLLIAGNFLTPLSHLNLGHHGKNGDRNRA